MIINNSSGVYDEKLLLDKLGKDVYIMNSIHYKYIWSLNHERNSNIKNIEYPANYIKAIREYIRTHKSTILMIDIDKEDFDVFSEYGVDVNMILESISENDMKITRYNGRMNMLNLIQQKIMERSIYMFYETDFLKLNETLYCKCSNRLKTDKDDSIEYIKNYNVFSISKINDELVLQTQILAGRDITLYTSYEYEESGVDKILQVIDFYGK